MTRAGSAGRPPRVSVVMPVLNMAEYVGGAIESILAQTFRDFEFIIIDDGSTDETPNILAGYDDPRIRIVRHRERQGIVAGLNRGIALARGEFVARQDADDLSTTDRLLRQVRHMDANADCHLVSCRAWTVRARQRLRAWQPRLISTFEPEESPELMVFLCLGGCFAHTGVMFRRRTIEDAGGYAHEDTGREDHMLWLRLAGSGRRMAVLRQRLVIHRDDTGIDHATRPPAPASAMRETLCGMLGRDLSPSTHRALTMAEEFSASNRDAADFDGALLALRRAARVLAQRRPNRRIQIGWFVWRLRIKLAIIRHLPAAFSFGARLCVRLGRELANAPEKMRARPLRRERLTRRIGSKSALRQAGLP